MAIDEHCDWKGFIEGNVRWLANNKVEVDKGSRGHHVTFIHD